MHIAYLDLSLCFNTMLSSSLKDVGCSSLKLKLIIAKDLRHVILKNEGTTD